MYVQFFFDSNISTNFIIIKLILVENVTYELVIFNRYEFIIFNRVKQIYWITMNRKCHFYSIIFTNFLLFGFEEIFLAKYSRKQSKFKM